MREIGGKSCQFVLLLPAISTMPREDHSRGKQTESEAYSTLKPMVGIVVTISFQFEEDCGLASSIETDHQDSDIFLAHKGGEKLRDGKTHDVVAPRFRCFAKERTRALKFRAKAENSSCINIRTPVYIDNSLPRPAMSQNMSPSAPE
jgi:hypothetical protein